ncbi:hypothetical protein DC20_19305 [Rufibacter tibetensis]|uniref:Uncharacterized protein n=1 Tax=Rufibacter tibetensis TaxID=512763 RepID=A0A0P0C695_9BACT|nr:hypothetical protein DC20_19305 [Rufibacter tibetensis]
MAAGKMRFTKSVRLIWTFYTAFAAPSMVITLACLSLNIESGLRIYPIIFWFKVATLGVMFLSVNSYKRHEYFYYLNLGFSKVNLWTSTLSFDFLVFLFLNYLPY